MVEETDASLTIGTTSVVLILISNGSTIKAKGSEITVQEEEEISEEGTGVLSEAILRMIIEEGITNLKLSINAIKKLCAEEPITLEVDIH